MSERHTTRCDGPECGREVVATDDDGWTRIQANVRRGQSNKTFHLDVCPMCHAHSLRTLLREEKP